MGEVPGATAVASAIGLLRITIPNYRGTVALKGWLTNNTRITTAPVSTSLHAGSWPSTAPITSVAIMVQLGNLAPGSTAVLRIIP